jgi:hypothetical protein
MADGVVPSKKVYARIGTAVKHFEQTYINPGLREEKVVRPRQRCTPRNEEWVLTIGGTPTGGTFDLDLNVLGVTETMQFAFDDTAGDVETELETHTNIANGDVTVTGGPFPDADIKIEFTGDLAKHSFPKPPVDFAALTGGSGVVVLVQHWTPGEPKDGSVAP